MTALDASSPRRRRPRARRRFRRGAVALPPFAHAAEELLVLKLSAKDGKFEPLTLEVPAGKRFKIEISNDGKGPMEFESKDLKQEKVLAAGAKSSVVINALKPGTYVFFDEYHRTPPRARSSRSSPRPAGSPFMGNALFIIWRESAEAMLVVGILYAWLTKQPD